MKSRYVSRYRVSGKCEEDGRRGKFAHQKLMVVIGVHEEGIVVLLWRWGRVGVSGEIPVLGPSRVPEQLLLTRC